MGKAAIGDRVEAAPTDRGIVLVVGLLICFNDNVVIVCLFLLLSTGDIVEALMYLATIGIVDPAADYHAAHVVFVEALVYCGKVDVVAILRATVIL